MSEELENEEQVVEPVETEEERLVREEQERLQREEQERLIREQLERIKAEEEAREQARLEHEALLNSFSNTTVFYRSIIENVDGSKSLGNPTMNARVADKYGWLDNHYDLSELTYIGNEDCGIYYLKGYEKPEKSLNELQLERYHLIDSQIEAYLDAKVKEHNYKSVESCVSYYNSTDEKYRSEARAVSEWRDHIYHTGEQVWQSVLNGLVDYKDVDLDYIINIAGDFSWEPNV